MASAVCVLPCVGGSTAEHALGFMGRCHVGDGRTKATHQHSVIAVTCASSFIPRFSPFRHSRFNVLAVAVDFIGQNPCHLYCTHTVDGGVPPSIAPPTAVSYNRHVGV